MKKHIIPLILCLLFASLLFTCRHPVTNPLDPASEDYVGFESLDNDGDGIGQWEDVDDITFLSPKDGETITELPLTLVTYRLNPEKVQRYWIQISTSNSNFEIEVIFSKDDYSANECEIPSIGLEINTPYYWRAKAFDGNKWSDSWSEIRDFVINVDTNVPWYPSPSSGSAISDTTPLLDWEDVAGTAGYHIQVNTNASFTGTAIVDDSALVVSQYPITTVLSDNATYYWRVRVNNADGLWGNWTNAWSFSVDIPAPATPSPQNGATISDSTPLLDWEDLAVAKGYHLLLSTSNTFSTSIVDESLLTISQYQVSVLLSDNTTYYWRVKIQNEDNVWGDWSNVWNFVVDIEEPKNPNPTNNSEVIDRTPLLDWEDVSCAMLYHIQTNTNSDFTGTSIADDNTLVTSQYQIATPLSFNTEYYWRVRVKNSDNVWGDWSDVWHFRMGKYELKWTYHTGYYIRGSSSAIGSDGTIYIGSWDGNLYSINPDGTLKWSYTIGLYISSSPAIGSDGTIYIGSDDSTLYAVNPNGTLRWAYTTGGSILSSPAIGSDGTIYVGSEDRKLYAVNPNGTLKWSYTTYVIYSSPAIASDGTIYFGSQDGKLYAVNPDGTFKWSYTTGGSVTDSPAIASDGTILVGSLDHKLYAIDPNGTLKWSYTTGGIIGYEIGSSPAIASDGTIYVGSHDCKLYALNPDGTLKWNYTTGVTIQVV